MDQKFFDVPFAFAGDQAVVPDAVQPDGSVSYNEGFGFDYQRDLATDPLAKPVDRSATNNIFFSITQAIAAIQKTGIPEWVTPAQNNGTALPYPKFATVRYSATIPATTFETYISAVDNNTSVPGADTNWQPIASIVATSADVLAGTSNRLIVTPASLTAVTPGRLLRTSVYAISGGSQKVSVNGGAFTSTGATTWSALSNTSTIVYEGCGSGGGGGGAGGQGSSTIGLGQSGGAGSFGRGMLTAGFSGAQAISIGVGGAGGAITPTNGANGSATTFGVLAAWPGGVGGAFINGVAVPAITGAPAGGTAPSGANVTGSQGEAAGNGFAISLTVGITGKGGSTPYGAGGAAVAFGTAGQAGGGNGAGGSGGAVGGSGSGQPGGPGAGGLLIIREYA